MFSEVNHWQKQDERVCLDYVTKTASYLLLSLTKLYDKIPIALVWCLQSLLFIREPNLYDLYEAIEFNTSIAEYFGI